MTTKGKPMSEREEQLLRLRDWIKPGDTVYTILRHVSSSRMTRDIGVVLLKKDKDGVIDLHPNYAVSKVLGYTLNKGSRDGVRVSGCGMDLGFEIVYNLGRALWPDGAPCAGQGKCWSNDHTNGLREYGKGIKHKDGGYTLRHRWL